LGVEGMHIAALATTFVAQALRAVAARSFFIAKWSADHGLRARETGFARRGRDMGDAANYRRRIGSQSRN
jgi:hypothetical protein